jgi:dCTP deaminase
MTIICGDDIEWFGIVHPFLPRTKYKGLTFGVSPAGYDVRVKEEIILPPHEFKLASTVEHFVMPNYIIGVVHDKSTWARRGLAVQNTVIEPGWRGFLTLELSNNSNVQISIEAGMPIAQILFHRLNRETEGYEGKYQNQKSGVQEAIFDM